MNSYIILNLVPVYKEAPSSYELFKRKTEEVLTLLLKQNSATKYLIINKKESENLKIKENFKKILEDITLIETDYTHGFVFDNHSAVLKILGNEKPIPSNIEKSSVFSLEEFLEKFIEGENKTAFIFGAVKNKGMHVLNRKITGREILNISGSLNEFKGMYLGYPMGLFISSENLDEEIELRTDYIEIYGESNCILDSLLNISKRFLDESCGRCVFGYEGTSQINMILNDISMKKGKAGDLGLLMDLCTQMQTQCLCDIGSCLANSLLSCIDNFKEEIIEHINKKNCRSLVCSRFITYHILSDRCTGCTECVDACDDDAILGKNKFVHVIDQDECTQCGKCIDACDEGAIVKAGSVKPKCPAKPIPCRAK